MSLGNIIGSASFQLVTGKRAFTLGLQDAQGEAQSAVSNITNSLFGLGRAASQAGLGLTAGLTAPIVGLTKAVFDIGTSFESAFAGVAKTFPGTIEQLDTFRQSIRDMANEMPSTREEIAGVAEMAGQLGVSAEGLEEFTRTMVMLGEATNLTATEGAVALARFSNIMGTLESDFSRLGATVVDLGNNFATTEQEIVNMATRIAGAGTVVGLTEAQVLGLATAMSSVGIRVEAGGTAISRVLVELANAVAGGTAELELFAHVAGTSVSGFQQAFEQDAAGALTLFIQGLNDMDAAGQNVFETLDDLGLGEVRVRDTLLRLMSSVHLLNDAMDTGASAWKENTALVEEYERRVETVDAQIEILKNRLTDVAVSLFDAFRPQIISILERLASAIQEVTSRVSEFLAGLDDETKQLILIVGTLTAAFGPALLAVGAMALVLSTLLNPIGLAITAIGLLAGAFITIKTNSEFFESRFEGLTAALETFEEGIRGLLGGINELEEADTGSILADIGADFIKISATIAAAVGIIIADIKAFIQSILALSEFAEEGALDFKINPKNFKNLGLPGQDPFIEAKLNTEELNKLSEDFGTIWGENRDTVGSFEEFFAQAMEVTGDDVQDFFKTITEGSKNFSEDLQNIKPLPESTFEGSFGRFEKLFDEFVVKGARSFDLVKERAVKFATTTGGVIDENFIRVLKNSQDEAELFGHIWLGVASGVIDASYLMAQAFYDTTEGIKFLEENDIQSFAVQGAAEDVIASLDPFSEAIRNAGTAISFMRENVDNIRSTLSLWKSDLSDVEEAIEITQGQIDKHGDPDGKLAKRLETLGWYNERLGDRIDYASDAWAESIAVQGDVERQLEELDRQFKENLISPEEYATLTEDLNERLRETQDPMDNFTGDLKSIAESMAEGIQVFKDLLIELGLLNDETGEPIEANFSTNAKDTAEDIRGLREDEIEQVPEERDTTFNSIFANADQTAGYIDSIGSAPTEINTLFSASTEEGLRKIQEITANAIGFTENDYTGNVYVDAEEALETLGTVHDRADEIATNTYEATLDADTSAALAKIDPLLARIGTWATSTYTAKVDIDTSGVKPAVDAAAQYTHDNLMAQSPTKEGPLSTTPDWSYLFEGIPEAAEHHTDESLQHLQNFVNLASSIFDLFNKSLEFSTQALEFSGRLPSLAFVQELAAFAESITAEVGFVAQQFEEGFLDASNRFNSAAQSSIGTLTQAVDLVLALSELGGKRVGQLQLDQISDLKFFVEHLVTSIGDTAALMEGERGMSFIQLSDIFAKAAQSSLALIIPAVEALQAISQLGSRTISQADFDAASQIKFFIEHLVTSIGDSAQFILSGREGSFFENSEILSSAGLAALELVTGISDALEAISNSRPITQDDYDVASNIKFFIEHLVTSFGDSAALLASQRDDGFLESAEDFLGVASAALSVLTETLDLIIHIGENIERIVISSDDTHAYVAALAGIALDIADLFDEVASRFEETVDGSIDRLATAVSNSVGALSDTLGFIIDLGENVEKITISSEETHAYAAGLAGIALDLAQLFDEVAHRFEETVEGSIEKLATAVGNSVGALGDTLGFLISLGEGLESITISSDDVEYYAKILADHAVVIAEAFNRAAEEWDGKVHPESEKLAGAISDSLGAIGSVLSFLGSLTDTFAREEKVNFGSSIAGIAAMLARRGREAAEAFTDVIKTWEVEEEVAEKISLAGQVIQDSFGALNSVLSFMEKVTADDFEMRGGQLREAARRIAELGVNVGNILASAGLSLSEDSKAGLETYSIWFTNMEGIFNFLASLQDLAPDAVQNAYIFLEAAREIAAAVREGTMLLNDVGLADLAFSSGFTTPSSNVNIGNDTNFTGQGGGSSGPDSITINLDIDGETFQTFVIDTVNGLVEEIF